MKFDDKFQNERMNLVRRMSSLIEMNQRVKAKRIPKLVGTQVFLKRYERLPKEKKLALLGEYKRRLIRLQTTMQWVVKKESNVVADAMNRFYITNYIFPQLSVLFRKMSDVDGSRNVPLTPNMSTLKRG